MKKALITGITGQDGSYLAEFLLDNNHMVSTTYKSTSLHKLHKQRYISGH